MRTKTKPIFLFLSAFVLLVGCGDQGNQTTGTTGSSSGNGGAGGDGGGGSGGSGMGVQIETRENAIPGQYIFVLDAKVVTPDTVKTVAEALLATQGGTLLDVFNGSFMGFSANGLDDPKALAMAKDPRVTGIVQDYVVGIDGLQMSPPWGLDRIDSKALQLDDQFSYAFTGKNVHVYVVDTGIRSTHQDFGGRVIANDGVDTTGDGKGTTDCHGHGTHVAGIIGGTTFGVAKEVTLHPVRVMDCGGKSSGSKVIKGLEWIRANVKKPAVVNMSISGPADALADAVVNDIIAKDVPVVTGAGNSGVDACKGSPSRVPNVFTVGATDKTDTRPSWSNWGTCVDLFAPGDGIASAWADSDMGVMAASGTSQAAPHVAGVIATMLGVDPAATNTALQMAVIGGATPNLVKSPNGSPNKLLYSRFNEPKTGFLNTKPWDNGYYSDAASWANANQGRTIQYADLNGDKKMDICGRDTTGIVCELSTGNGFGPQQLWEGGYGDPNGWGGADNMYGTIRFPDLNGDGKADVCGRGPGGMYCGLSDGTKFVASAMQWDLPPVFTDANGWTTVSWWTTIQFPDVNGDGKADVCGRTSAGVVCGISTGTAFGPVDVWDGGYNDANGWGGANNMFGTITFPDLNGDGKADVCGRGPAGLYCGLSDGTKFVPGAGTWDNGYFTDAGPWSQVTYWRTIQYADLNGDKLADVCGRAENGMVCLLSTGTNFGPPTTWDPGFYNLTGWDKTPALWSTIRLADVTGDGKADVCGRYADGVVCALSVGSSFAFDTLWTSTYSDPNGWATQDYYYGTIRFPDINGDGRADICGRNANGIICGTATP